MFSRRRKKVSDLFFKRKYSNFKLTYRKTNSVAILFHSIQIKIVETHTL